MCDRLLRDDLMALTSNNVPLWDGRSTIVVRQARPDEEAKWTASRAKAIRRGDIGTEDDTWIAFLVGLSGPARHKP
jgi:hypothetical protein